MGLQLSGSVQLEGNLLVTGSANSVFENVLVSGRLTAQEIETQFVSASIIFSSGSNKFGDESGDKHQFTGSVDVSGSLSVIGTLGATTLVKTGGTSTQFLKADGSVDTNTYALNSALSNYLLLSGGSLTGPLASSSTGKFGASGLNSSGYVLEAIGNLRISGIMAGGGNLRFYGNINSTNYLEVAENGTITAQNALNGTSAVFTANEALTINASNSTSANNTITGFSANLYAVAVRQKGASAGIGGTNFMAQIISAAGAEGLEIYTPNAKELILGTNSVPRLTLASTGAATFSSSVTAGGNLIFDTDDRGITSNTADGADNKFVFVCGGGGRGSDRGGGINLFGNESGGTGRVDIIAGNLAGGVINLQTGGVNNLTVVQNGNVGIGTAAPTTRLDIGNGTLTLPTLRGRTYQLIDVSSQNPNFINGTGFNSIPVRVGDVIDLPFAQTRTVTAVTDAQLTVNTAWSTSFGGSNVEGRGGVVLQTNNLDRVTITGTGEATLTGNVQINGALTVNNQITSPNQFRGFFGSFASGGSVTFTLTSSGQPSAKLFLIHAYNNANANLNLSRLIMVNVRNLAVGGGNSIAVISTTQNSTGVQSEIAGLTQSIGGSGANVTLVIGGTINSGEGTIEVSIQEINRI